MADRLFVDTWAWLVLANDRDPAFERLSTIRALAARERTLWVTTDYVLDETMTRLFSAAPFSQARRYMEGIFTASREGALNIEHVTPDRFTRAWRLRLRYHDKSPISFTDLTSFVVMQELGLQRVLTADAHFVQIGMGFLPVP
ncbi:MAG: type II toxin-antitoxin system VapC family toxin [Bryobacterales bacterium]|nr:type II toxin-antitoxin system VapC family toxin [Bryobacterales bacterium]